MPEVQRQFIDWVSQYTMSAKGSVLKMSVSVAAALVPPKPATGYRISSSLRGGEANEAIQSGLDCRVGSDDPPRNDDRVKKLSPKQQKVMAVLSDGLPRRASEIAEAADCSAGVVKTLAGKGIVEVTEIYNPAPCRKPDPYKQGEQLQKTSRRPPSICVSMCGQVNSRPRCWTG